MSRRPERAPSREGDDGFSLIEVVVSLGIIALLVVALLPQLVTGIRANELARTLAQTKGVAQAEAERMRNLPFHVAPEAGEYIDVLDRYFRNRVAPTATISCGTATSWTVPTPGWTGYVGSTGASCPWEPPRPFYRHVRLVKDGTGPTARDSFAVATATRFLSSNTPAVVVDPPTTYDSQVNQFAAPPTSQLGVTVSVFPIGQRGPRRPVSSSTQIARPGRQDSRVTVSVVGAAVQLGTTTPDGLPLSFSAGRIDLAGGLASTSTASGNLTSALTGLGTGSQAGGARTSLTAPPTATASGATAPAEGLQDPATCPLVCWGATSVSAMTADASNGLPTLGSPTSPVSASITSAGERGLSLSGGEGATYRDGLALRTPLVRGDTTSGVSSGATTTCRGGAGSTVRVSTAGWARTTSPTAGTDPSLVEGCAVSRALPIVVLPTDFAPDGLLRISLDEAWVRCTVAGSAHVPSNGVGYSATIRYWTTSGYQTVQVRDTNATDPLASLTLGSIPVGPGRVLGDYLASWSSASTASVGRTAENQASRVDLPGVVTLVTQPLRKTAAGTVDTESTVSLAIGNLGCSARDVR